MLKTRKVVLCLFLVFLLTAGAAEAAVSHTVQKGESVWLISQKYGTTINAVASANNIPSSYLIYPPGPDHTGKHRVSPGDTSGGLRNNTVFPLPPLPRPAVSATPP